MGKFLETEKERLIAFKAISPNFSDAARDAGTYRGKPRPFCLPNACADENLFSEIREPSMTYFSKYGIKWHDGHHDMPSNHLCDSQVCCVNFLYPFADKPQALRELLRPLFPDIALTLPIEAGKMVAMEWIGRENYLGEKVSRNGRRTRGANFTSADAAVKFERHDGQVQIVLIEWKYTESYSSASYKQSRSGTDRTAIYRHLYDRDDFPLRKDLLPGFDALFYEPFYQLMRQQLLANEMEKQRELDADIVSLLHICPAANADFQKVTSPPLRELGDSVTGIWQRLQTRPDRFASVGVEDMFGRLSIPAHPQLEAWWQYVSSRYSWLVK